MAAEGGGVSWKKGVGSRMGCEVSSRKEGAHLAPAYVMAQRKHSQVSLTHGGCDSVLFLVLRSLSPSHNPDLTEYPKTSWG